MSENYRKCGKPNCTCAQPDHPGHGPRFLWTRTARRRGTVGRQLAAGEVEKVRREVARHAEFASVSERIAEVNEKICEARPAAGTDAVPRAYPLTGVRKDELATALGYFENNAPRMRYHWFRSRGLFVGSGVVEASCKSVIGLRLKQSGMHWTVAGAITTLRCQQASRPEDQICIASRNQAPAA